MPLIARIALVFASGAVAGAYLHSIAEAAVLIAGACALLFAFARGRESMLLLAAGMAAIGLGAVHAARTQAGCTRTTDKTPVAASGVLETVPTELQRTVRLRVAKAACGRIVRVRIPDGAAPLAMGDAVRVSGSWMTLRVATDGRPATDGIVIAESVRRDSSRGADPVLRARGRAQQRIHELFPVASSLAESLLIAQRENLDPDVRENFAAAGLTHLLAISGTHVALVAASLLMIARLMRCTRRTAAVLSIAGSTAYVFFLGAPYAALRALIQMALLLVSRSMQRPAHPLGLLSGAAIIIVFMDPAAPLDPGFQLSFAGICGIVLWRRPLIELLPSSLPVPLRDAIATTCAATAITTPIAGYHFGVISTISLIANLLAIPVVSIAVPAAAAALAVSGVSMEAGRFLAQGAELALVWLYQIALKCAHVPGGHFVMTPAAIAASCAAAAVAFGLLRERPRTTLTGRMVAAALAGAVPPLLLPVMPAGKTLQIHMLDVGQGDAFAIRTPRGRWLLIDAGPKSARFDAGKRTVLPFLLRKQASHITAVIVSHPHLDHFGGLGAVAKRLRVGVVLDPALPVPSPEFDALLAAAQQHGIPWTAARTGVLVSLDDVRLEILGPDSVPFDARADPNLFSAAVRLEYQGFTALFLGDMPSAAESRLVERFRQRLDVDLLKVSHHGSGGSSNGELIVAASPRLALISAGRRNRYGHPHARVVSALEAFGTRVFRSDRDGTVSVSVDRHGRISVRTGQ